MIVGTEKRCSKCRIVQPIEQFSPSRTMADGRNGWCKIAEALVYSTHKAKAA